MVTPEQLDDFREAAEAVVEFAGNAWVFENSEGERLHEWMSRWENLSDKWHASAPEECIKAISEAVPVEHEPIYLDKNAIPNAVFPTAAQSIGWIVDRLDTTFYDIRTGFGIYQIADFTRGEGQRRIQWPVADLRLLLFREWKHGRPYVIAKATEIDIRGVDYVRDLAVDSHLLCLRVESCILNGEFMERHEPLEDLEANREKACQELEALRLEARELDEKWSHPAVEKVLREIERAVIPVLPIIKVGHQKYTTLFAAVSSWCTSFALDDGVIDGLRAGTTTFAAQQSPHDLAMVADFETRLPKEWAIASGGGDVAELHKVPSEVKPEKRPRGRPPSKNIADMKKLWQSNGEPPAAKLRDAWNALHPKEPITTDVAKSRISGWKRGHAKGGVKKP